MNTSRIAVVTALLCIGAWTLKAITVSLAGGPNLSPLEDALFLFGLVASLTAVLFLGLALSTGRPAGVRVLAAIVSIVVGVAFSAAVVALVEWIQPADAGWIWGEINLWVFAAVLLAATVWSRPVRRERTGEGDTGPSSARTSG
ncbi:MAG TPA: hypothetical protein VLQ67_12720 [Arachnia sp.]|nr:hypothetical protein [Arachnia sp.]